MVFIKKRTGFAVLIGLCLWYTAHAIRFPDQFCQIICELFYSKVLHERIPVDIAEAQTIEEYMHILEQQESDGSDPATKPKYWKEELKKLKDFQCTFYRVRSTFTLEDGTPVVVPMKTILVTLRARLEETYSLKVKTVAARSSRDVENAI